MNNSTGEVSSTGQFVRYEDQKWLGYYERDEPGTVRRAVDKGVGDLVNLRSGERVSIVLEPLTSDLDLKVWLSIVDVKNRQAYVDQPFKIVSIEKSSALADKERS